MGSTVYIYAQLNTDNFSDTLTMVKSTGQIPRISVKQCLTSINKHILKGLITRKHTYNI